MIILNIIMGLVAFACVLFSMWVVWNWAGIILDAIVSSWRRLWR